MFEEFAKKLEEVMTDNDNYVITENGAVGFKTTGKKLLDLNFALSSFRSKSDLEIKMSFIEAFTEDPSLAAVWLFYSRDVRGGLGERHFFRVAMKFIAQDHPDLAVKLLPLIAEYGRWDDLIDLYGTRVTEQVLFLIKQQLDEDIALMQKDKSISLLAKWLPSENASSKETTKKATAIRTGLNLSPRAYRRMLSALRNHIDIVERKMSSGQWGEIDYEAVPSRANIIYKKAFLKNDKARREKFLAKLEKGEAKINSSAVFPHDIVHSYVMGRYTNKLDPALEGMWKALPDTVKGDARTIVVRDGSGSMTSTIGGTKVSALTVATALAIYFAERLSGAFKDKFITFSEHPAMVNMSGCGTLKSKIDLAMTKAEVANTNIEAVFNLILQTAVDNHMEQEDIPANILILSDMEFDSATGGYRSKRPDARLFTIIAKRFEDAGYKLPRLVFWNLNSRTGAIPVVENALGVALVSGFSQNVAKMVLSGDIDPMKCLVHVLNDKRYDDVRNAVILDD